MASKVRFILTCDGICPLDFDKRDCPHKCPSAEFEREYLNTELPEDNDG